MDVVTLDKETYRPVKLVEGLSSKIWTERYTECGEFEFRSSDIEKTMNLIPENTLISLRDTEEVMLVESHSIEEDGEEGHVLVSKGRTAECILESRAWAGAKYGKKAKMRKKYTIQGAIGVYLVNTLANYTGVDLVSKAAKAPPNEFDLIENLRITLDTHTPGKTLDRFLENSQANAYVDTMLAAGKFGIRNIRPTDGALARYTVYVKTDGTVSKVLETSEQMSMEVFEGYDRTLSQDILKPVIFAHSADHIDKPTYLFSSRDYKGVAMVISASGPVGKAKIVERIYENDEGGVKHPPSLGDYRGGIQGIMIGEHDPTGGAGEVEDQTPKGWNRRVVLVDAGTKDEDDTTTEFLANLPEIGSNQLKANYERQTVFDGIIAPTAPYQYKVDYDLGDRVTLLGQYGLEKNMQVQEYIRSENDEGETGYPGLILWT